MRVDVLLVDDREDGLITLEALLGSEPGYNLIRAQSGKEAIGLLPQFDFALILLDVQMPELDGFETAQIIRSEPRFASIPIVFVTAINKDDRYIYRGYEAGAVDYVFKPFDPLILRSKVSVFVDLHRKNRQIREQAQRLAEREALEHQALAQCVELESLRRYRNLADAIPHIVLRTLPDRRLEYHNRLWSEYTGRTHSQSAGIGWQAALHEEDLTAILAAWDREDWGDARREFECRVRRADGEFLSAELTAELRETLKIEQGRPVLGFVIPKAGVLSGTQRRGLVEEIRAGFGDCGLDFLDVARLRTNEAFMPLAEAIGAKLTAEQIVFGAGPFTTEDLAVVITPKPGTPAKWNHDPQWIWKRVGALRLQLGQKFADKHGRYAKTGTEADYKFLWVTDFPMYEWDEEAKVWQAAHHPFTSPHEDDIKAGRLTSDKGAVRALAYDVVLNGTELGSGSIRIHRKDVQAEIFRSLGMSDAEAKERFGFFLDALEYGTPPHGGIALGLDRIVMILAGATSLREVIAFPKTARAIDLMVDAPSAVSEQQIRELSLRTLVRS